MYFKNIVLLFLCTFTALNVDAFTTIKLPSVLVFSKTKSYRHLSIPNGIQFLANLKCELNWNVDFSEDATDFTDQNLKKYDVVLFLNTSGDIFNQKEQKAFKKFIKSGKGFVGIHAAADTEKKWFWYTEMLGATFKSHPKIQEATVLLNAVYNHSTTKHLKSKEIFKDEWYNFIKPVKNNIQVLATLDETSYEGEKMNTKNHPIIWKHNFKGGRIFYSGLGHTKETYLDKRFQKMIKEAILWAANKVK